jgi:uncharacterized damage-inducible protein DinB
MAEDPLREALIRALEWGDAHVTFEAALADLPAEVRARRPEGLPYSAWELLEHLRMAQLDILDFCRNPEYREMHWPDDYWPKASPANDEEWQRSIAGFRADREALKRLAAEQPDLFATIPHGTGQTYLRELLLVIDHNAYHIGQLIAVRRALGAWSDG